jgi:hypothetical protein
MFGISRHAAHGIFAVGLTGLITLTTAPAFASTAPAGHAATHSASRPAGQSKDPTARYHSWRRAQRAAGFRLKVPARTYGLTRKNAILVGPCDAAGQRRKRDVYAEWGAGQAFLAVDQNNSGGACSNFGAARFLGRFRVQGHRARMYGFCGSHGLPSCRSKAAVLVLTWRAGKRFYVVYSSHQWRATLLGFARRLRFL